MKMDYVRKHKFKFDLENGILHNSKLEQNERKITYGEIIAYVVDITSSCFTGWVAKCLDFAFWHIVAKCSIFILLAWSFLSVIYIKV